jgi:FMN phosphatase YigB (HAD superfamily)
MTQGSGRGFEAVEIWVFDLDNTLYPHHLNLWQQVDARIRDYIVDFLKVTRQEAVRVQKDYYRRYGTTTRSIIRRSRPTPRSAPRSPDFRAASSFSPTARAGMPTR